MDIHPMGDPDNVSPLINNKLSGGLNVLRAEMIDCHSRGHYFLGEWLRQRGDSEITHASRSRAVNLCMDTICVSVCHCVASRPTSVLSLYLQTLTHTESG